MKALQEIDVEILRQLLKDGRKSFTAIAKENKTTKDVVWKHYKDMESVGIIVGATVQFNFQKLGYSGVAVIMINVESQSVNEVFNRLTKIPDLTCYRYYNSTYNIAAISRLKSLRDIEHFKAVISKEIKINEITTNIWTNVRNIPENILSHTQAHDSEKETLQFEESKNVHTTVDDLDKEIIEILTKDGRLPFKRVSEVLGVSTDTVARRYEKLTKANLIKVSIQINPLKLGYQAILDVNIALKNHGETSEIVQNLSEIPAVSYLVKLSGSYDLSVAVLVKDCRDIIAIDERIASMLNVKRTEATLREVPAAWPGQRQYLSTF